MYRNHLSQTSNKVHEPMHISMCKCYSISIDAPKVTGLQMTQSDAQSDPMQGKHISFLELIFNNRSSYNLRIPSNNVSCLFCYHLNLTAIIFATLSPKTPTFTLVE